jgi:hypothetical protein
MFQRQLRFLFALRFGETVKHGWEMPKRAASTRKSLVNWYGDFLKWGVPPKSSIWIGFSSNYPAIRATFMETTPHIYIICRSSIARLDFWRPRRTAIRSDPTCLMVALTMEDTLSFCLPLGIAPEHGSGAGQTYWFNLGRATGCDRVTGHRFVMAIHKLQQVHAQVATQKELWEWLKHHNSHQHLGHGQRSQLSPLRGFSAWPSDDLVDMRPAMVGRR